MPPDLKGIYAILYNNPFLTACEHINATMQGHPNLCWFCQTTAQQGNRSEPPPDPTSSAGQPEPPPQAWQVWQAKLFCDTCLIAHGIRDHKFSEVMAKHIKCCACQRPIYQASPINPQFDVNPWVALRRRSAYMQVEEHDVKVVATRVEPPTPGGNTQGIMTVKYAGITNIVAAQMFCVECLERYVQTLLTLASNGGRRSSQAQRQGKQAGKQTGKSKQRRQKRTS